MSNSVSANLRLPALFQWTAPGRALVFCLAASSIWCLLAEMYNLVDMRSFFYSILLPSTVALYGIAFLDNFRGDGRLWRAVIPGTLAGLFGAVAYDIFRLPFVYSDAWGLGRIGIPQMPLFKVFPRFGALILGGPIEQESYSLGAQLLVMFAAIYAGSQEAIRLTSQSSGYGQAWKPIAFATLMAAGIELCLLASPYANFFGIPLTTRFVIVTLLAHIVFGLGMGAYFAWHATKWRLPTPATAA
jgi:hypothetical protein